ncbi:aldo/keto reductase [Rhodospirillaceae bacterium SYSU D60014]|uniref:aldo/keto reductase n=1 Tax=Virgifigura deserti TaxID=2268457 RepID=UPI000E66630F
MRTIPLSTGESIPVLGQGTWHIGDDPMHRREEIATLRLGLDLGMTLIDTAEMYGDGASETVVAEAIAGRRDEVFLVSKVLPENATRRGTVAACEASLRRLRTDRLDLYLLHWRGMIPLAETIDAFQDLVRAGKIRHFGVSNFDLTDLEELWALDHGRGAVTNQVLYNLTRRGTEWSLLPWCRANAIPVMAYSPFEQGDMLDEAGLKSVARRHDASPAQIALAWILHQDGVMTIPKTGSEAHLRENRAALDLRLTDEDMAELDRAFPPPRGPSDLAVL